METINSQLGMKYFQKILSSSLKEFGKEVKTDL